MAKIIQNVATHTEFGEKEEYMCCCNPFIKQMVPRIYKFYVRISSKKSLRIHIDLPTAPVQRQHYHLLHVALANNDIKKSLRKKKGVRKTLEEVLEKLGVPEKDQRPVHHLGYVDLEKIVENMKNPDTGIFKSVFSLVQKGGDFFADFL